MTKKELLKYTGNYWSSEDKIVRIIKVKDNNLIYWRSAYSESIFIPVEQSMFEMQGETEQLTLRFGNNTMVFDKQPILKNSHHQNTH